MEPTAICGPPRSSWPCTATPAGACRPTSGAPTATPAVRSAPRPGPPCAAAARHRLRPGRGRFGARNSWPTREAVGGVLPVVGAPWCGHCCKRGGERAVAEPSVTGRIIAAWPSFALIGSDELLMRQIRPTVTTATAPGIRGDRPGTSTFRGKGRRAAHGSPCAARPGISVSPRGRSGTCRCTAVLSCRKPSCRWGTRTSGSWRRACPGPVTRSAARPGRCRPRMSSACPRQRE